MPVLTLEVGKISKQKKQELVNTLVSRASTILDIPEESFVTIIRENEFDNIGNGIKLLSDIVKEETEE